MHSKKSYRDKKLSVPSSCVPHLHQMRKVTILSCQRSNLPFDISAKRKIIIYGTPFAAKLCSTIGSSYFKNQLSFLHTRCFAELSCRTEPVFYTTDSVSFQNQLDFFKELIQLFYRTNSAIFLLNLFFREPSWFFCIIKWGMHPSRPYSPTIGHMVLIPMLGYWECI